MMIKRLYPCLVVMLVLGSCAQPGEAETKKDERTPPATDTVPFNVAAVSTAMPIEPLRELPTGFYLDSFFITDNLLNHRVALYYPLSETDSIFNRKLVKFIRAHEASYQPDEKGDDYQSSSFDLWLVAEEHAGRKQSFKFRMQSYYPGAAHYNRDSAVYTGFVK